MRARTRASVAAAVVAVLGACGSPGRSSAALPLRLVRDVTLPGSPSRFDYEDVDPTRRRLVIAHLGASRIDVVDLDTLSVTGTVEGLDAVHGVRVAPDRGLIYASATGSNSIVTIDEATRRVLATAPAAGYPDGLAYAAPVGKVYVSDESGGTETVLDARDGHRVGAIALGGEAGNVVYDPVAARVFVDVQTRDRLAVIDPATDRVIGTMPLPGCRHDHGLLIDPTGRLAFVACDGNARLLVVELASGRVVRNFPVGDRPDVLAFDAVSGRLYVASESGVVAVFGETGTNVVELGQARLAAKAHSVAVDPVTHRVFFPLESSRGRPVLRVMAPA